MKFFMEKVLVVVLVVVTVLVLSMAGAAAHAQTMDAKKALASMIEKGDIQAVTQAETCPGTACRTYFLMQGADKVQVICTEPFFSPAACDLYEANQCVSVLGFPIAEGGQHFVVALDVLDCPE